RRSISPGGAALSSTANGGRSIAGASCTECHFHRGRGCRSCQGAIGRCRNSGGNWLIGLPFGRFPAVFHADLVARVVPLLERAPGSAPAIQEGRFGRDIINGLSGSPRRSRRHRLGGRSTDGVVFVRESESRAS